MNFFKASGASNDFILLDLSKDQPSLINRKQLVQKICDRKNGVGADGFVFLDPSDSADFKWDFYNTDGSHAEMCGNAARCVILYWLDQNPSTTQPVKFETVVGVIEGVQLAKNWIDVQMPHVDPPKKWTESGLEFEFVNTGVPHAVVTQVKNLESVKLLRRHARFGEHGTNVTFIQWVNDHTLSAQTFERGVEDYTLACGTGAVAAALVGFHQRPELESLNIQMPGGELVVSNEARPRLTGEAHLIAKFEWLG